MIKSNLKAFLAELRKISQYQTQKYKKRNDCKIFHLSVNPIASDSDIDEAFKFIYQSITIKTKNLTFVYWLVETIVEHCIKIFDCQYKKK